MAVVLLAAGRGSRFNNYLPKSLVELGEQTVLEGMIRLIRKIDSGIPIYVITGYKSELVARQISEINDERVECVHNDVFEDDQNIISARLGLEFSISDTLVLEGDCIFNMETMEQFIAHIGRGTSVIFANEIAITGKNNAIVTSNDDGTISGYNIGERAETIELENWNDMAGAAIISNGDIQSFMDWFSGEEFDPRKTYYFQPLLDFSGSRIKTKVQILSEGSQSLSFNTQSQLIHVMERMGFEPQIKLIGTNFLRHVEGFSKKRVNWLKEKIVSDGIWNKPICIDGEFGIVMDGQHRMEVAKELGLVVVPALIFSHKNVEFWSLRANHEVSLDLIMENYQSGKTYPYKTVKYGFPVDVPVCSFGLEELS